MIMKSTGEIISKEVQPQEVSKSASHTMSDT